MNFDQRNGRALPKATKNRGEALTSVQHQSSLRMHLYQWQFSAGSVRSKPLMPSLLKRSPLDYATYHQTSLLDRLQKSERFVRRSQRQTKIVSFALFDSIRQSIRQPTDSIRQHLSKRCCLIGSIYPPFRFVRQITQHTFATSNYIGANLLLF